MVKAKKKLARKRKLKPQRARTAERRDEFLEVASEHYDDIVMMYKVFEDKKPVMLYDIQEQRIYAYPYKEFRVELSERSQRTLKQQYEQAQVDGKMVVFVRDNVKQKLVSFSLDHE